MCGVCDVCTGVSGVCMCVCGAVCGMYGAYVVPIICSHFSNWIIAPSILKTWIRHSTSGHGQLPVCLFQSF